jgi:hypothetical protein
MDISQINTILGVVAVIISISIGAGTLRQRANEPNEKRWREYEEWKAHIDSTHTNDNKDRWKAFEDWKGEVDDKIARDYKALNTIHKRHEKQQDFEMLVLSSMKAIMDHLATGNHNEQMGELSKKLYEYLLSNAVNDYLN